MIKQIIKGNQILFLTDPHKVWSIQSGSLALFASFMANSELIGPRHYLFSLEPLEATFGAALANTSAPNEQLCMIAVALEDTEIVELSLEELSTNIINGHKQAIAQIEGWIHHLGEWILSQGIYELTGIPMQQSHPGEYLSLPKQQGIQPSRDEIAWIKVRKGDTKWLGNPDFTLNKESPIVPLAPSMWLEAKNKVEIYCVPTSEIQELSESLALLHSYFLSYFNLSQQQQLEDRFRRFQERERVNTQLSQNSMAELAGVIQPPETPTSVDEGTPLLMAVGAIGRALGIKISPPAQSEDLSRVKDPLEAISRASQFRTRRVILAGQWWLQEHGPLLAYQGEEKKPVALLPESNNYVLFDPQTRTRTTIDEQTTQNISPEAYMFYRPLLGIWSQAYEIFVFGVKGYELDLLWVVLLGVVGSLLGMVTPQATALLVNNAIPDGDRGLLWQLGLGLFGAALGKSIFTLAQGIVTLRVENAADGAIQPAVWDRLLNLTPGFFRQYSSGDLLNRLLAVGQIRAKLSGATQRTLLSALFALLNLILMFVYSVQLAWVTLGLTVVVVIVTVTSSRLLLVKQRLSENLDGVINGLTVELINGVAKLRVAAAEERAFAAWAKKYSHRTKLQLGVKRIDDSVSVFNETLSLIASVLLFWFAILFIQIAQAKGESAGLNMGIFLAFNSAFGTFLSGTIDLSNTLTDILEIVPLWERAQPILGSPTESDPSKADPGRLTGRLSLDHVTFRYREDGPLILEDVSIHAEPGEFVALVGPSGSGKSTIFRLLLGFETPISGTVYYDGQDLAGVDIQAIRRQLGVVLQNVRLSSASIVDSITCGALVSLDEAWQAARMAGFAEDVEKMPMGMHTVVSEGGTNLSGGQRQRLLIARALVLKPKIILMDEATSALDNRTQAIVTESLGKMNATRIVVAHRLSTIRDADRIYVIEAGRVVQVGNFDQLVNQDGAFARLVARQIE